jgi:C4-dicarboxylate-specific signal transduction histidine kinase
MPKMGDGKNKSKRLALLWVVSFVFLAITIGVSFAVMGRQFFKTKASLLEYSTFHSTTRATTRALMQVRQQFTAAKAECVNAMFLESKPTQSRESFDQCVTFVEAAASQINQETSFGKEYYRFSVVAKGLAESLYEIQDDWLEGDSLPVSLKPALQKLLQDLEAAMDNVSKEESLFWTRAADSDKAHVNELEQVEQVLFVSAFFVILLFGIGILGALGNVISTRKVLNIQEALLATQRALDLESAKALHSSKLHSLGELAAGIGHEINNPLAVIIGRTEQLLDDLENAADSSTVSLEDVRESTQGVLKQCERIVKIVKSLKNMSRKAEGDPFVPLSLAAVVADVLTLSSAKFGTGQVKLFIDSIPSEALVLGHESEIGQVIINLVNNGFDAVVGSVDAWVKISVVVQVSEVVVRVLDSGKGIPDHISAKMFEPFFTTKDKNKGTGLGVSISLQILRNHGGDLWLEKDNPNTCFVVRLPRFEVCDKKIS